MPSVSDILDKMDYGPARESDAAARDWIAAHAPFGHYIGGEWVAGSAHLTTQNPATGEDLAQVADGTGADVAAAVRAARAAQPVWAALSGHQRARYLYAMARHLQQHERLFALLEVLDSGKPIREARSADLPQAVRHFYHHAGWAELVAERFPGYQPHGVCGQIIPWNFPLMMLAWKIAPALAAGNTVVLKPAGETPLSALRFAQLCDEIGLPPGVVNIVTGGAGTGAALVAADLDKIAFTGSSEVGGQIAGALAGRPVALTLELGGKSPFVVLENADLDAAVAGVVDSIWFNQGQVCCAGSRLLVAAPVMAEFTARLTRRMARLRLGDPLDKSTDLGAIISPAQAARIAGLVDQAQAAGARLLRAGDAVPEGGNWIAPGVLEAVEPTNPAWQEEIFGPIATLTSFRSPDEAIALANQTRYGLAASIWSENITEATAVAAAMRAGVVWINGANMFDAAAPFGGMRDSGFGREGGAEGMAAYLRLPDPPAPKPVPAPEVAPASGAIDRTAKFYIGGAQVRPDGGAVRAVPGGLAGIGGRKDIRNAVAAAGKAAGWAAKTGHQRAQVLYFIAENLAAQAGGRIGAEERAAAAARLFYWAAWADKDDGRCHDTQAGCLTVSQRLPYGVIGIAAPDEAPLLGLVSLLAPAIAAGNRVVALPSRRDPLVAADFCQVLDCSDLPGGVVNIVAGTEEDLIPTLAAHEGVDALWLAGAAPGACAGVAGALKPVWQVAPRDWQGPRGQGDEFRRAARQIRTIWLPYGL